MVTDKPPYATTTTSDDIYFTCVDLVLSAAAPIPGDGKARLTMVSHWLTLVS